MPKPTKLIKGITHLAGPILGSIAAGGIIKSAVHKEEKRLADHAKKQAELAQHLSQPASAYHAPAKEKTLIRTIQVKNKRNKDGVQTEAIIPVLTKTAGTVLKRKKGMLRRLKVGLKATGRYLKKHPKEALKGTAMGLAGGAAFTGLERGMSYSTIKKDRELAHQKADQELRAQVGDEQAKKIIDFHKKEDFSIRVYILEFFKGDSEEKKDEPLTKGWFPRKSSLRMRWSRNGLVPKDSSMHRWVNLRDRFSFKKDGDGN